MGPLNGAGYDIALFIVMNSRGDYEDYHWLRQDSNGKWSHKRGLDPVTNTDASGNLINNPQVANMNYDGYQGVFITTLRVYRINYW